VFAHGSSVRRHVHGVQSWSAVGDHVARVLTAHGVGLVRGVHAQEFTE
jgi:hypothetical protein